MNQYDHIRKSLKEYSVPVDKDKLWANTAHAIPKKRRKRGAFFLLPAGALLIGSALTYYILSSIEYQSTINTETLAASVSPALNQRDETSNTVTQTTANNSSIVSTGQIINPTQPHEANNNKNNTSSISTHPDDSAASISRHNATSPDQNISENQLAETNIAGTVAESSISGAKPNDRSDFAPATDPSGPIDISTGSLISIAAEPLPIREHLTSPEIAALPIASLSISGIQNQFGNPVASPVRKTNRFNIRIMQGYGLTTMKISTDSDELEPVLEGWEDNIKSLENLSTSLHASIRLPKGIQFGAGLQYSKLTTQMGYQQTSIEDYTEQGTTEIIIDEQGNVQNLVGDVNVQRQTILQSTRFTSHTRLDIEGMVSIPVLRSFRHETGIWVKAGYNLLYTSQGTTFGPGDQPISFTTKDNPFTLASPFTFGTGISTLYRINPHWMLNASLGYERLRYKHGLYNNQITSQHSIFSLSLGTGYVF
jgi:hypothetical protein